MTPAAALLFTILFVADESSGNPAQPPCSVVVEVVEDAGGRHVDVVVVRGAASPQPGVTASLSGPKAEGSRRLRDWPWPPPGASFTPAVDGVVVTIDDVGDWQPPVVPVDPKAKKPPTSTAQANAPDLPVASERALRLFLPTIVDEKPVPASLHGSHTRIAGQAVVVQRKVPVLALSLSTGEADGGAAIIADEGAGGCAPIPFTVVQGLTKLTSTAVTCAGPLAVSAATGKRFFDKADKDRDAVGVVVRRVK